MASFSPAQFPRLEENLEVDVAVVGAGIAGLTTAYFLARSGARVAVLDKEGVGGGETGRTSAHLSSVLDYRYAEIARIHGKAKARVVAESHSWAIDTIEILAQRENIACQFARVPGYLMLGDGENPKVLEDELEAAAAAGLTVEFTATPPLLREPPDRVLRFAGQAQFHPMRYLDGLAKAVVASGGRIHGGTAVESLESGEPCRLQLSGGYSVRAGSVVRACSTPFTNVVALHTKQAAYRTFVAAYELATQLAEPALIWDTADPFRYVRLYTTPGRTMLLVGGEDYKTGHDDDQRLPVARLTDWALRHFDIPAEAVASWSGQVLEPVDRLAFIGRNPADASNVYVVSGTSGNGLTYGTIAGRLLTDLIEKRENSWTSLYEPGRVTLASAGTFISENADVAAQYADWLTPGEKEDAAAVAAGSGAVVRRGASKIAVYRDPAGKVTELSAVCPHLGCVVAWNPYEKSWDCPCHGSRFSPDGRVLNGPAASGLAKA
jgi:glycine/D-amino acid oxidase-like deaminating enzyme/nitrite reductase/ring-hydroxylating ferredoxin subunit